MTVVKIGNENSAAASCSSDGAVDENKYVVSWGWNGQRLEQLKEKDKDKF